MQAPPRCLMLQMNTARAASNGGQNQAQRQGSAVGTTMKREGSSQRLQPPTPGPKKCYSSWTLDEEEEERSLQWLATKEALHTTVPQGQSPLLQSLLGGDTRNKEVHMRVKDEVRAQPVCGSVGNGEEGMNSRVI